jgi:AcrR family transcriptional regulator
MVQRLKEEVRESIVAAALEVFAGEGYEAATMAAMARAAGISTGNVYRYFPSKKALFAVALPPRFVAKLTQLLRQRMRALRGVRDVGTLGPKAAYHLVSEELLQLCLQERLRVIILLSKAEGTAYAGFSRQLVGDLATLATRYARSVRSQVPLTKTTRFNLAQIYRHWVDAMVEILAEHEEEGEIRAALDGFMKYHLAGLKSFFA